MGDYDLIIIVALIGGLILFYIFASSGLFGKGLKDALSPLTDIANLGGEAIKTGGSLVGIVGGNQQLGEPCEKKKLACGAGLVCDGGVCAPGTAKIGERCTAGTTSLTAVDFMPVVAAASGSYSKKGGIECENGSGCVNNICVAYPTEEGDPCYPDKLKCPSGLRCNPRTGWGKCFKEGGMDGEKCILGNIECGEDHTCITPNDKRTKGTEGVCVPNRDQVEGGPCRKKSGGTNVSDFGNTVECGKGLMCVNNVCTSNCKPGTKGQECEGGMTCWPRDGTGKCYPNRNQVEGGVCVTKGDTGKNTIECGTGLSCVNNKCIKDAKDVGDRCMPGTKSECPNGQTCWPRDGTGVCYKNRNQTLGGVCITKSGPGENRIECGSGLSCWPTGVGKCIPNRAGKGERCITGDIVKCTGKLKCKNTDSDGVGICQ